MCGICGIYSKVDKPIEAMLETIKHRGQDGFGVYKDENVGLGHNRLAIIDLSENGKQPMHNEDNTVWMVVNGEIYNYKDLKYWLIQKGHQFYSNSDSEVIIHLYEQIGEAFVSQLRGMFALALYDKKINRLILARDSIGKKPLYYYRNGNNLYFASEIKALLKAGIKAVVNTNIIPTFLMYQYSMGIDTLFNDIHKLKAGHKIIVDGDYVNTVQIRYFTINENIWNRSEREAIDILRTYLDESVELRLQSDVPIGAFLSGGIDSSAVIALWRRKSNKSDFHTFTASFETNSESEYAKQVSKHLGVQYHEVPITTDMVLNDLEKIAWHYDEPLGDAAIICNYYLAKEASKYVKVVLAGEGGDELFGGYQWYSFYKYINIFNCIPISLRNTFQILMNECNPINRLERLKRILLFPMQNSLIDLQLYPETSMSEQNVDWIVKLPYISMLRNNYNAIKPSGIKNQYNRYLALDCLNLLPEKFLMKADKATMAWTIEERLPLLDKEIINYAFTLTPNLKKDKYILRKAVEDLLPKNIVLRKKQGFGTPVAHWLNNKRFKEYTLDKLRNGMLLKEICKPKSLEIITKHYESGNYNKQGYAALQFSSIVWNLLVLQIWYDVYTEFTK